MRLFEVYQAEDNVTQLADPGVFRKEWKIPHEEVEDAINRWVNQDDHIE